MAATFAFLLGLLVLCACLAVFSFVSGAGQRRLARRARRLGAVDRGRPRAAAGPQLRRESNGALDLFIHRILPQPAAVRARLAASGSGVTIGRYGLICLGVAATAAALLLLRGMAPLAAVLGGLLAGLWLPHVAIGMMVQRRRAQFSKLFPEAIGLIIRGLKAGIPAAETLIVVGREVADPVGEEFRHVSDQLKLGQRLEDALWAVAKRLDIAEFNFFVITLSVQRETGGNLAETLENLEDILRKRQQMKLKVKAMSSEAKASAGIIGCLPFVMSGMLFMVSRAYIMTLFTAPLGHILLAGAAISLGAGIFVMARMVQFEI